MLKEVFIFFSQSLIIGELFTCQLTKLFWDLFPSKLHYRNLCVITCLLFFIWEVWLKHWKVKVLHHFLEGDFLFGREKNSYEVVKKQIGTITNSLFLNLYPLTENIQEHHCTAVPHIRCDTVPQLTSLYEARVQNN